jgi:diguanylate cyclase (GGDEF)-like protein
MTTDWLDAVTCPDFHAAASDVLSFLHERLDFRLWLVTRTEQDDWIVLRALDDGCGVQEGAVFRWADTLCARMVAGRGPRAAPRVAAEPAYATAPLAQQLGIGAYIGVPLMRDDGSLFGTLCGLHPAPRAEPLEGELPLLELLARLLSSLLQAELQAAQLAREAERARAEALSDSLTGLYNRRGWDQLIAAEESRCRRYGHAAGVIAIDLDGLKAVNDARGHAEGDRLLQQAARALRATLRQQDILARVGGDEFAVLAIECDPTGIAVLLDRVRGALLRAGAPASVGGAVARPARDLHELWQQADQNMYHSKRTCR